MQKRQIKLGILGALSKSIHMRYSATTPESMTICLSVRLGIHTEQAETVVGTVPVECLKIIAGEWSVSGIPLRAENGVGARTLRESEMQVAYSVGPIRVFPEANVCATQLGDFIFPNNRQPQTPHRRPRICRSIIKCKKTIEVVCSPS